MKIKSRPWFIFCMVTGCKPRFFRAGFAGHKIVHADSNMIQAAQKTIWIRRCFLQICRAIQRQILSVCSNVNTYTQYLVLDPASVCATQKLFAARPRFFQDQKP